jgi:lysophospholipase
MKTLPLYIAMFAIITLGALPSYAIPEADYAGSYNQLVSPWADLGQVGTFNGVDGKDIGYISFVEPTSADAIIILNGRTENYLKYLETAYDLRGLGLSIYMMDHRGQGHSERVLSDRDKGYVKNFDDYVKDLKTLVDNVVKPAGHGRIFLVAHSLGGAVATRFAQTYPGKVHALILSAPMLQINTSPYPESLAYAAARTLTWFWQGESYAPGRGSYSTETFEEQTLTTSEVRYAMGESKLAAYPELRLGGPTNRWLSESIWATWKAGWYANKLTMPVLLFQAGNDQIVNPGRQNSICSAAPDCELVALPGAEHELLIESDSIRDTVLHRIHLFINSHR